MGHINKMTARTSPKFAMFDPTTLPKARSGCPLKEDCILTINSGADVAKETTVIPMTIFGIENLNDKATAACISQSPPFINKKTPIATAIKAIN